MKTLIHVKNAHAFLRFSIIILLSLPSLLFSPVYANNQLETDHALMSRFEGAKDFYHLSLDYVAVDFPIGIINKVTVEKNTVKVAGKGSFIKYDFPDDASTHQVIKTFQTQLKTALFNTVFECNKSEQTNTCGNNLPEFSRTYKLRFGLQNYCISDTEVYFSTSKFLREDGKYTYVFICIADKSVNQTIVEEKDFNPNKIQIAKNYQPTAQSLSGLQKQTDEDIKGSKDHPLINRFPNSVIHSYQKVDFAHATLPIKKITDVYGEPLSNDYLLATRGAISFREYSGQKGLSLYQVYENYLAAFKASDMEILFACNGASECGEGMRYYNDIRKVAPALNRNDDCSGESRAIITARKVINDNQNIFAYMCISNNHTLNIAQTIIEEKPLKTGLVSLSANDMKRALAAKGKVAIYGIHFTTNSDELLPESLPAFKQLSTLLTNNTQLTLYVVGHTDSQGEEHYNQNLAEKRAKSVVKELVHTYGIAPKRLQARGVGELVPVSTNQVDSGRALNRRVELVEM